MVKPLTPSSQPSVIQALQGVSTEAVDDEGDEFGDGGGTHSDAAQQLTLFLDEAVIVEYSSHITRH